VAEDPRIDAVLRRCFREATAFDPGIALARPAPCDGADHATRVATMRAANPAFIPRNHRIEAMIEAAIERDNYAPFNELLEVLERTLRRPAGRSPSR
jgi:serine/tyrosine/threonine adenylyltransferase